MPAGQVSIEGALERVVYANEDTGWSVVKLTVPGQAEPITAVGSLAGVQLGENVRVTGSWVRDPKYGEQLRVESFLPVKPSTLVGIERYLGSGLVPGIGPTMAKRLVAHFGLETLDVIERDGHRLVEVEGIGRVRAGRILEAWTEQRGIKDVMVFLQSHGVSSAFAVRIYKRYGTAAVRIVRDNPYQLALDIFGIGFLTADRIAASLGVAKDSPQRAEAGVLHALRAHAEDGHVYAERALLVERARELLGVEPALIEAAIDVLAKTEHVVTDGDAVYARALHDAEVRAARRVAELVSAPKKPLVIDLEKALAWFEAEVHIELAEEQRRALASAIEAKLSVITGGPGTGKTTIVNGIIRILEKKGRRILLAAPTGRAAKRMFETTGRDARTIHRLLEIDPQTMSFLRDESTPLEGDVIIVDEVSMVDLPLFDHLLRAIPPEAQLVLVGDVDQLPSVGPGSVLRDVIASGAAAVTVLDRIFRQAEESLIVTNAHRINRGEMPEVDSTPDRDFYLIERTEPEAVVATLKELIARRVPARFGVDPVDDIQVLTPMHKGSLGAQNLNAELQALLNPDGEALTRGQRVLRAGDKVMQLRNNYDLGVFNGDIGRVRAIDLDAGTAVIRFDDRDVLYESSDLDELTLAYACTIHKSQGSEYPVVLLPLGTQHFVMLARNLLYTAVTRGRRLVVVVGSRKALELAVARGRDDRRASRLEARIASEISHIPE